ncbi:MAG: hypothetical protein ACRDKZ_00930 [Actinomycetota bacterium]
MPTDLRERLEEAAARPESRPDVDRLWRRARRLVWASRIGAGGLAVVLVAVGFQALERVDFGGGRVASKPSEDALAPLEAHHVSGRSAYKVSFADGRLWMTSLRGMEAIDAVTEKVVLTVLSSPFPGQSLLATDDELWTATWEGDMGPGGGDTPKGSIARVRLADLPKDGEAEFRAVTTRFETAPGETPSAVAVAGGAAWVTNINGGALIRVDANGDLSRVPVDGAPADVVAAGDSVWVAHTRGDPKHYGAGGASLLRLDAATGEVVAGPVPAGTCPGSVDRSPTAVWVADYCARALRSFDPITLEPLEVVELEGRPGDVAVGGGLVWASVETADEDAGTRLVRIDERTLRAGYSDLGPGNPFVSIDYGAGSLWVSDGERGVLRLTPEAGEGP